MEKIFNSPLGQYRVLEGSSLLFSAPHEMAQIREGVAKVAEAGTANLAFRMADELGASAIATFGEQMGDPNWDIDHPYRLEALQIAQNGILIDLHMMSPRGLDICLGLGSGNNLNRPLWTPIMAELLDSGFSLSVNWPFASKGRTITAASLRAGLVAIQIEISYDLFDSEEKLENLTRAIIKGAQIAYRDLRLI
jgi:hypothetical protein